ncbi:MAG: hypothetical protein DRN71_02355 [Candidatus Nanohalarchaeota archaeon]|nr:MAG: hypothetical protein DRN71_02355 [Candidatus Nanohaloarchaeota archaeon]
MVLNLREELDFLKRQVLSENDRKLEVAADDVPVVEEPVVVEKVSQDNVVKVKRRALNRPSKREAYIVYYKLNGKSNVEKVQFSYALTGRTNQIGILQKMKGKKLGRGCLLVPSVNLEQIQEFFKYWTVDTVSQKILLLD